MARLRADFNFGIRSLWVERSALDTPLSFESQALEVELCIPWLATVPMLVSERLLEDMRYKPDDKVTAEFFSASELRVSVMGEAPFNAALFFTLERDLIDKAYAFMQLAYRVAEAVAIEFIDWTRVTAVQPWLGMHGEYPQLMHSALWDVDANEHLPIGERGRDMSFSVPRLPCYRAIGRDQLLDFRRHTRAGAVIPMPETLLADAGHLLLFRPPAVDQAVLIAAVACELKVKQTLRERAGAEFLPWVELLLNNPRDWSLVALSIFDKAMKAAVGRSLREEDLDLYKMIDKLFQERNRIAHKGGVGAMELTQAFDLIKEARRAIEWLSQV
jgi:hypothetical protein